MEKARIFQEYKFSSYADIKRHRNDYGLQFYLREHPVTISIWSEILAPYKPYDDKSQYGLYYNFDDNLDLCGIYYPIEDDVLQDFSARKELN